MKFRYILIMFFCGFIFAQTGGSSGGTTAKHIGMANAYTASINGVDAVNLNPANLALPSKYSVEFITIFPLPNIRVNTGSGVFNIDEVNYFFGPSGEVDKDGNSIGKKLTQADKQRLSDLFKNGDLINAEFSLNLFAIKIGLNEKLGSFGFSINDRMAAHGKMSADFIDLLLNGNDFGQIYNFNNFEMESYYLREFSLSYGRNILTLKHSFVRKIYAGITAKIIQGYSYARLDKSDITFETTNQGDYILTSNIKTLSAITPNAGIEYDFDNGPKSESDFSLFPQAAGAGFGFNFAVTAEFNDALIASIVLSDVGSVNWDKGAVAYEMNGSKLIDDLTNNDSLDSLKDIFDFKGKYINGFDSDLPTALHMGAEYRLDKAFGINGKKKLLLTLDYHQGFNNVPGNSTTPRFVLGCEWEALGWLYLRTGFSVGGLYGFQWSSGLGIDTGTIELNFATQTLNNFFAGNSANYIGFAFDSKWKF